MSNGVEIHTDGGCMGNPGPGAWAFVIRSGSTVLQKSGFDPQTTNNRMELTAVIRALEQLSARPELGGLPVTLFTDSQYVQKGITEWILAWVKNGWKTSTKKPVKNAELWMALWKLSRERAVTWHWVMGHAGDHWNEVCDRLVQQEIKQRA
jgi:ribonuclease HI